MTTETTRKRNKAILEAINVCGLILVLIGTVLIIVGYFVPQNYTIDPDKSARENERRSLAAGAVAHVMDILIIVGTVCIGVGGFWVLGVILYSHLSQKEEHHLQESQYPQQGQRYGSVSRPSSQPQQRQGQELRPQQASQEVR